MGNCISQQGVLESEPPASERSRACRFLRRFTRGLRRRRARVDVESSSHTEKRAATESQEYTASQSSSEDPSVLQVQTKLINQGEAGPSSSSATVNTKSLSVATSDAPFFTTVSDIIVHANASSLIAVFNDDNGGSNTVKPAKTVRSDPLVTVCDNARADNVADTPVACVRSEPLAKPFDAASNGFANGSDLTRAANVTGKPARGVKSDTLAPSLESSSEDKRETSHKSATHIPRKDQDLYTITTAPFPTPASVLPYESEPSTSGQPANILFYNHAKSPAEAAVRLTVKRSLELIKEHEGRKGTVAIPVYVRSVDKQSPRLITVYATRKEVKDGSAKKLVLKMKHVASKEAGVFGALSAGKSASRMHIGQTSGLVATEDSCARWIQKESSVHASASRTSTFNVPKDVKLNFHERLGLAQLQKYEITVQCKAIERIKLDEGEFPGILPPELRKRWLKRMKKDKEVIN